MAAIAPGTGGSFKSSTAEGRAIEAIVFLQLAEQMEVNNPQSTNGISGAFDTEEKTFQGTYSIPASQTINGDGQLVIAAVPYLDGVAVVPGGDNPTFKSTVPEAYLLECLMYLQGLERNPVKNPQGRNNIVGTYDSDRAIYSGSFSIPVQPQLTTDGGIRFEAVPYLTT